MSKAKHTGARPEPDALVPVNDRDTAFVNTAAPLTPGCGVALLYRNKRFKPKFGRYRPGNPPTFAEYYDVWEYRPGDKLKKPKPISNIAYPVLLLSISRSYTKRRARKGGTHA